MKCLEERIIATYFTPVHPIYPFQPGEGPSRGLLRDCTTGCGTDWSIYSTNPDRRPARGQRQLVHGVEVHVQDPELLLLLANSRVLVWCWPTNMQLQLLHVNCKCTVIYCCCEWCEKDKPSLIQCWRRTAQNTPHYMVTWNMNYCDCDWCSCSLHCLALISVW